MLGGDVEELNIMIGTPEGIHWRKWEDNITRDSSRNKVG
jgi:hypothetical protein